MGFHWAYHVENNLKPNNVGGVGHNPEDKVGGIGISKSGDFQHNWKNWSDRSIKLARPVLTGQATVKRLREVKHNVIHIKVPCLSNIFDKVCFTSILSNSQSDHISLVDASINNTIMHNVERSIEGDNLLVGNKTSSDCID
jgi:hypothetical protein